MDNKTYRETVALYWCNFCLLPQEPQPTCLLFHSLWACVTVWLQGKAALQTHSFRDAEPPSEISTNATKQHGFSTKKLRSDIDISLTITDPCLPTTAWQCSAVCYSRSSQFGSKNMQDNLCSSFACAWLFGSFSNWALITWCWWWWLQKRAKDFTTLYTQWPLTRTWKM